MWKKRAFLTAFHEGQSSEAPGAIGKALWKCGLVGRELTAPLRHIVEGRSDPRGTCGDTQTCELHRAGDELIVLSLPGFDMCNMRENVW